MVVLVEALTLLLGGVILYGGSIMKKFYGLFALVAMFLLIAVSPALAVFPPVSLTALDVGSFEAVAGLVIVALAAMWGINRALGMIRGK